MDEGYDSYDCLSKDVTNDSLIVKNDNTSVPPSLGLSDMVSGFDTVDSKTIDTSLDSSDQTVLKSVDDGADQESCVNKTDIEHNEIVINKYLPQTTESLCSGYEQTGNRTRVIGFGEDVQIEDEDMDEYLRDVERSEVSAGFVSDLNTVSFNSDGLSDANSFPPQYSKIDEMSNVDGEMKDLKESKIETLNIDSQPKTETLNLDSQPKEDLSGLHLQMEHSSYSESNANIPSVFQVPVNAMDIQNMQMPSVEMGGARPKEPIHHNKYNTMTSEILDNSETQNVAKDVLKEDTDIVASKDSDDCQTYLKMEDDKRSGHCDSYTTDPFCDEVEEGNIDLRDENLVMRRNNQPVNQSDISRPHSWGPSGTDTVPIPQQKRPNSLNLPQRDFNLAGERSQVPYTFPYPPEDTETVSPEIVQDDVIQTEEIQAVGEEPVDDAIGASGYTSSPDSANPEVHPQQNLETPLGIHAPTWIPDSEALVCMGCEAKFTFTKRRHHCRACGKVFCSSCCRLKCKLQYMDNKEARVCVECHRQLAIAELSSSGSPNPNNPSEYCSVIPPSQQATARSQPPSVLVPASVLKREGSNRTSSEGKHVMFSDGIRPGGDLTELDGSDSANRLPLRKSGRNQKKIEKGSPDAAHQRVARKLRASEARRHLCLIPETGLPPVMKSTGVKGDFVLEENQEIDKIMPQIKDEEAEPVIFALNANLFVLVKIINLDCCVNRTCWCFTTKGMCNVGQDEIVFVLEVIPDENVIPLDIMRHFYTVYEEAGKGNTVTHMGHTIFNQTFLDSRDHGGMLYIRPTFQCLHKLLLPSPPYVFGILLQKWETPWAKVFPLRLLLRLGAEYRYYPCPLISVRNRKPVFFEIGHTIMNLLADFRNFQYMLPQIKGVSIHMEDKKTIINFPRNRYEDIMKVVSNSNEHVMALGASFSLNADSHLVCIQNDDGNYQTQAINIQNKARKVTGASFVVFNGALKTSSGLKAKSSIVEDGLMVQITPDSMLALKQALKDMSDYRIECGSLTASDPDEVVTVTWGDDDKNINIGVKSPIDDMSMDGIESIHIPNATDYVGEKQIIRWTDVFFIQNKDSGTTRWEPVDLSRLAETLSNATCIALTPHLDKLKEASLTKIALRVNIEIEKVGYEIGSNGERLPDLYMNDLDNELIPVIHSAASQNRGGAIILELIFHILD